jgi:hypothetical protein
MNTRRFDKNGMMIIPNPVKSEIMEKEKVLVIRECFCKNGHNLVNSRVRFNEYNGIILIISSQDDEGMVALSPIYGDKTRISIDIDLLSRKVYDLICPTCRESLPEFAPCSCGAEQRALFSTKDADFSNCTGICNRVDCPNAVVHSEGEMISISMIE